MVKETIMVELDPGNIERAVDQLVAVRDFLLHPTLQNGGLDEEANRYALANLVGAMHDIAHLNAPIINLEPVCVKRHKQNEEVAQ